MSTGYNQSMNLLLRALYLVFAFIIGILFLSSATLKTGGANFDIFIIPTLVALAVIFYAKRINEARYIPLVALGFVIFGFTMSQGEFWHSNLLGASTMTLLFHALWRW